MKWFEGQGVEETPLHVVGFNNLQRSIVRLQDVKESATWEATHAIQQRKPKESLQFQICVPKTLHFVVYF